MKRFRSQILQDFEYYIKNLDFIPNNKRQIEVFQKYT